MIDKRMKKSQSMESDGEQVLILLKFLFKIPVSSIFVKARIFMAFNVELITEIKMFIEVFSKDMTIICVGRPYVLRFMYP